MGASDGSSRKGASRRHLTLPPGAEPRGGVDQELMDQLDLPYYVTWREHCSGLDGGRRRAHVHSGQTGRDRKSTRLNSSHVSISYAVFCLKKKKEIIVQFRRLAPLDFLREVPPTPHYVDHR